MAIQVSNVLNTNIYHTTTNRSCTFSVYILHVEASQMYIRLYVHVHVLHYCDLQATVRKTMSEFRRTHHDSWSEHKQKFSDDQLAILADLLVSPSYYA